MVSSAMTKLAPAKLLAHKRCEEPVWFTRKRGLVFLVILLGSLLPVLFLQQSFRGTLWLQGPPGHWLDNEDLQTFTKLLEDASTENQEVAIVLGGKGDYLVDKRDLLENHIFLAREAGLAENTLLVALDAQTASAASSLGYGYVFPFFNTSVPHIEIKYQLLSEAVALGHTVLSSTLEVAWLDRPWDSLATGQDLQLIAPRLSTVLADGVESRPGPMRRLQQLGRLGLSKVWNSGAQSLKRRGLKAAESPAAGTSVAYLRPSKDAAAFLKMVNEAVASNPEVEEREVLNAILNSGEAASQGKTFSWEVLGRERFWNGFADLQSDPRSGGDFLAAAFDDSPPTFSKRNIRYRLREAGLWGPDRALVDCFRSLGEGEQSQRKLLKEQTKPQECKHRKFMYYFEMLEHNGLNNQRQELRTALSMSEFMGRTLIMPKFFREHKEAAPVLLDYFFDYDSFEREFPDVLPGRLLEDLFPDWQNLPVQNIDISTDPAPPNDAPWLGRVTTYKASKYHFGATEEEVETWFGNATDPLLVFYSAFRRFGQLKDAGKQAEFDKRVYRGMAPHKLTAALRDQSVASLRQISPNKTYNCFHLRRGDTFLELHPAYEKTLDEIAELLKQYLPPEEVLYISTDSSVKEVRSTMNNAGYNEVRFLDDFFPTWGWRHVNNEDGKETMRLGQVDQAVCALGKNFVGNLWSTFTLHIGFIRRMNGETQVCQDIYAREEMVGPDFVFY